MRLKVFLFGILAISLMGCGSDGGGGSSKPNKSSALAGTYYMAGTHNATGDLLLSMINIEGNKIEAVNMLIVDESHAFVRRQEGTYTKNGEDLSIVWTYETCDPVGSETVKVSYTDPSDRIFVTIDNSTYQLLNAEKWMPDTDYTNTLFLMTEDVECNKFP